MSKKDFTPMKDENPDLKKQIGCISGLLLLFDRHRFLTGQRSSSHGQNLPAQGGTSKHIKELNSTMQKSMAKNVKIARENQQFSTESSGTSLSTSSCSSSLSSVEFNRTIQIEQPSISLIKIPENSNSGAAMKQLDTPGNQSLDFYDIVKDSMHREVQGLSVKTVAKVEKKGRTLKHIDSPRPLQAPKSVNTGVMLASEPFHILAKSQKTPWDSPRLSYDGRDIQDKFKSAAKHKELPRLSLDSRQRSIEGFNEGTKSHNLLKGSQKGYASPSTMLKQQQEPETSKRQSSVVVKLMGLEAFPGWTETCDTPRGVSNYTTNKNETFAKSSMTDGYSQNRSGVSPRTSKGPILHQPRRDASITNVTQYSRFSPEPTLWRQPDASQDSQSQASKGSASSIKASNSSLSVYGEIEKRMADLQFKNSGKDLRALKQILEAMQRYKDSLDITRDQASSSPSDSSLSESSKVQSPRRQQKDQKPVTVQMSNSTQGSKLPIVIMKPSKVTRKTNNPTSTEMSIQGKLGSSKFFPANPTNGRLVDKLDSKTAKGISPTTRHLKDPSSQPFNSGDKSKKMRTPKLMLSSKVPQVINGENTTNFSNTEETRSPRVPKKFGLERHSPPTSPSLDSSSNRRQHSRQSLESSSPNTTPRLKFSTLKERNEQFSKISCQRRDFNSEGSIGSPKDTEAIQVKHFEKNNSTSIQLNGLNQNNAAKELIKESFMAETIVTTEQPSPVSVLDAAFYKEDPPSPVKKKSEISKDLDEALNTYHSSEDKSDLPLPSNTTKVNINNGTSDIDLKTQNLVQILQQIHYSDQKFTIVRDSKDPDHKYISEILLASGLLSSPSSSQTVHLPDHPINPELFLALEQIKTNKMHFNTAHSGNKIARMNNHEQMQRKLIFDVVSDILVQKLILESSSMLWCLPSQPAGRKLKGQQLLDELCAEIDKLQNKNRNVSLSNEDENLSSLSWGDLMHHPTIGTNCDSEIPNIVLDIERLIFKDLITEVVRGEVVDNPGRRCRQMLFPK